MGALLFMNEFISSYVPLNFLGLGRSVPRQVLDRCLSDKTFFHRHLVCHPTDTGVPPPD